MTSTYGIQHPISSQRLFGLDHLRALAIISVFLYHYGRIFPHPEWTNSLTKFGWTGVDLFFVLSGYLISSQLFDKIAKGKQISFRVFFLKRFFRIIPAYLVIVAIYFLIPAAGERDTIAPLWKYLTFTQNIGLDVAQQGSFSHAWSLCIEEQFYLLFPLILITLSYFKIIRKAAIILPALFVAGLLTRIYLWNRLVLPFADQDDYWIHWSKWIYYPTFSRLDGLLTGVSIAAIFQFRPNLKMKWQRYGNYFLWASLLVLTAAYFLCLDQETFAASVFGFPLVSFGYGLLVISAISRNSYLYRFNSKLTANIAMLSYALYLSHKIIIHVTQEQFSKFHIAKDGNWMFLICTATSLAGAVLLNKIIEKPFLRLRDRLLIKR